jgi:hypothetical protein
VVKDADDCSDREWEDMKVVVKKEVVKQVAVEEVVEKWVVVMEKEDEKMVSLVVVVVEAQWEESQIKAKSSQESEHTHHSIKK